MVVGKHCAVKVKSLILRPRRMLDDDDLYLIIDLIREHTENNVLRMAEARRSLFHMPSSTSVSEYIARTLIIVTSGTVVFSPRSSLRLSLRLNAKVGFHSAER